MHDQNTKKQNRNRGKDKQEMKVCTMYVQDNNQHCEFFGGSLEYLLSSALCHRMCTLKVTCTQTV